MLNVPTIVETVAAPMIPSPPQDVTTAETKTIILIVQKDAEAPVPFHVPEGKKYFSTILKAEPAAVIQRIILGSVTTLLE